MISFRHALPAASQCLAAGAAGYLRYRYVVARLRQIIEMLILSSYVTPHYTYIYAMTLAELMFTITEFRLHTTLRHTLPCAACYHLFRHY